MTQSPKPNIIVVMTDQMRATAMGCTGVEKVITPNLDRFAAEGTRFTNAVSNTPACTPARATFLTGKHVLSHKMVNNDMQLGHSHRSLAHCLNDAGYDCSYIGKWHIDGVNRGAFIPPGPRRQGFDDFWAGTECNHWYFQGYYYDDDSATPVWFDCYEPEGQTDLAINYIEKRKPDDSPFCMVLSWSPPHCPYDQVPKEFLDMYPPDEIEFLPNAVEARIRARGAAEQESRPADISREEHDNKKRTTLAGYYAHVTAMDHCFGRLMRCIEEQQLTENTVVVFTSDHGDMLFSQNRGWKGKPWRESVGIPLLMRWPEHVSANRLTDGPIGLVDLMPTLLALAGVDVPEDAEGLDLSAFVLGDDDAAPETEYINFPCMPHWFKDPTWRGVVTRTHTFVATREGPWLLYDDANDPFQMENLVDLPEVAEIQSVLEDKLQEWLTLTEDDFPTAREIADRFCVYHRNNVVPQAPLEPVILKGQEERAGRRY
ncbi:sulfatase-like hydrolase/transferase [Candidatus Hydrogenedentota bacterium]